jgi:Ni,Fe-hydrogenase maturation factor
VDADIGVEGVVLEPAPEEAAATALSHSMHPGAVVALARKLYGFAGEAWWCRIPARKFAPGAPVSGEARQQASEAAAMLRALLESKECMNPR